MTRSPTPPTGSTTHRHDLQVALIGINYSPPFWFALEEFFRPMERVKWSTQLGATAKLRAVHHRIYRGIDKLMKEAWHTPQVKSRPDPAQIPFCIPPSPTLDPLISSQPTTGTSHRHIPPTHPTGTSHRHIPPRHPPLRPTASCSSR